MEVEKLKVPARKLKDNHRCTRLRERGFSLENAINPNIEKVGVQKNAIKAYFLAKQMVKEPHFEEKYRSIFLRYVLRNNEDEESVPRDILQDVINLKTVLRVTEDNLARIAHFDVPEIIKNTFKTEYNEKAERDELPVIKKYILSNYNKLGDITDHTCKKLAKKAYEKIRRYLLSETRMPYVTGFEDAEVMNMFDLVDVEDRPDLIFYDDNGYGIEAVRLFMSKPRVTQNGRTRDKSAKTSMELFSKWKYARELIKDDKPHEISGSFYYLGRADDGKRNGVEHFEEYFFETGGKNVVTMKETVYSNETEEVLKSKGQEIPKVLKCTLEDSFRPQFKEYLDGEICSGDSCEYCDFKELCNYAEAPLSSKEEKAGKSISDIKLSKEQEDAVNFRKGIARINAGAGCGKTLIVSLRTAYMLSEGISPEDILLITFTNAGAGEMKERIAMYDDDLMNDTDLDKLTCTTFNSFGDAIIRKEYERFGYTDEPRLIDDIERKELITELLNKTEIKTLNYENFLMNRKGFKGALAVAEKAFSIIKKKRYSHYDIDEFMEDIRESINVSMSDLKETCEMLLDLYYQYDDELKIRNLIEYQDQESLIFDLLDQDPYYFDKNCSYKHIIVDEFQDTSANQIEIIKSLIDTKNFESLIVVGDDSQSIYEFRDAVTENIVDFYDKLGKEGKDFYITANHRSTPEILAFANSLVERNMLRVEKELNATKEPGKPVEVEGFYSKDEECEYIINVIKDKLNEGYKPEDIAILAYTRQELLNIGGALAEAGIETSLQCPEPMLENSRVKGIISFSNALYDNNATKDILIYKNCMRNGHILDDLNDDEIMDLIKNEQGFLGDFMTLSFNEKTRVYDKMITEIANNDTVALDLVNRLKRMPNVIAKQNYIKQFVAFGGEAIKRDGTFSGVVLTTAHSSKGLEWPICINSISGYDKKDLKGNRAKEANRRLLFVSATRAKDELYITGQYRLGKDVNGEYMNNMYLKESYEVVGKEFSPRNAEEEKLLKEKERKEKAEKKKAEKLNAVKADKEIKIAI